MFGDFVRVRGGPTLGAVINISVALAIVNADIAVVVLVSRMLFSSGRDAVWAAPINRALTLVSARFGSPLGPPRWSPAHWPACSVSSACSCFLS